MTLGTTAVARVEDDFLGGGGELGALIRGFDWAATSIGAPGSWPPSLRMSLRIMLASRQPIWIGWGPELIYFYNDPYKSIIGGKHPWALGQPTAEVWREIWTDIAPLLETALHGEQGTYSEAQLLIMERNGYPEETYYTFSYSPIPNDDGSVGGIFCANSDDTQRVISERQLGLLRELATSAHARTVEEACRRSAEALATNPRDLPFAMIYIEEADGIRLKGVSGMPPGHGAAPELADLSQACTWPLRDVVKLHETRIVTDLTAHGCDDLPCGPWPRPPDRAVILPIMPTGETGRSGALVVGLNPFRLLDDNYRGFLGLCAGQISAAIGSAHSYQEERRRAEALAELDRAKTAFFSNVSHEFRTPLTLMLGPIEDALNADGAVALPAQQRERLDIAHRNSLRLLKLVNSLLDFSRIEAGRVEASFEPVDLPLLTAELASNFRSAIERAGMVLRLECEPLPGPVYVDRDMWEKIMLNLLSNAFKFTFEGEISVSIRAAADGCAAEVTVSDTGVGIPEHELPRLFERFHRIEGQAGRSFEGSGIGLALVQELVRLHGGTISACSTQGQGSSFTVRMKLGAAHLPAERINAVRQRASTSLRAEAFVEEAMRWLRGVASTEDPGEELVPSAASIEGHILVADDNADMRDYLRRLLASRWSVETAANGREALEAARARRPDLMLVDVMMPELDGFGVLREIRGIEELRDIPFIMLSARAGEEARVEGLNAGADDYLTKPFTARELVARIHTNLEMARIRREATRDLRESEARFRNMAEHAPVIMWMTGPDLAMTYVNRRWCEFTGQTAEAALGFGGWDAVAPEDRDPIYQAFVKANEKRNAFTYEVRLRHQSGMIRWTLSTGSPRFSDDGRFLGYIGSITDITDRKRAEQVLQQANEELERRVAAAIAERTEAEEQLRQAQRMEAIGRLTGGVAHDFNNVLQVVGGNLQLLNRDVAGNLRAEQRVSMAVAAVSRGSKLASQLLAFGRRQPLAPKAINLARRIRGLDDMLRRALGESIEIETVISGGLWNCFVDAVQVENALLNLAINARDAMPAGGRLTIEAGNATLDDAYASRFSDVKPGQYVMLAVTDTGCGIPQHLLDRVFEPFFTTKPEGQGTGLGLSMVYGFVKQSTGHIKIYSEVGHGTTVRIYLPRTREAEDVETDVDTRPVAGGSETVLVAEDDEDVRATAVDLLTELGYHVYKAKDAQSALAIIESGLPIDVLFTDVVMPGPLRSPELARKARERLPNIAVLFTSGYTDNAIVHGGRLDEGVDLLSKPYTREELARKLRYVVRLQQQRNEREGRVSLQAAAPPPAAAPIGRPIAPGNGAATAPEVRLRVLVVEDDPLIRLNTVDLLETLGHEVIEAGRAAEALAELGQREVDVMVTDLALPDIPGGELAMQAVAKYPALKVIFASGYDIVPELDGQSPLAHAVLLRKPYDDAALAKALRAVAGAGGA